VRPDAWLEPLRRELEAAAGPRTFCFRDDDAGWAGERLFRLLDLFAYYSVPLDLAVIPAALDGVLAARLRGRAERGLLAFHQHGFAHANHERSGRPCEFGPTRLAHEQRRDIAAGAELLAELLGETEPIFTPPWNRCTETTGHCLLDLGFRALARDSTAPPLGLDGLQELQVHVDWSRTGTGERLADASRSPGPVGVMLHHELIDSSERRRLERLLALLASHENAHCVPLSSLLDADHTAIGSFEPWPS
jgi:hypothetical protein